MSEKCSCSFDWGDFLHVRHHLIVEWSEEGRTPAEIAATLSMDPEQVVLISLTPIDDTHVHLSTPQGGPR